MPGNGAKFRDLLKQPGILISPGVFDGYSTRLVEAAGFNFRIGQKGSVSQLVLPRWIFHPSKTAV